MKQVKRNELVEGKKYWIEAEFLCDGRSDYMPLRFDFNGDCNYWFKDNLVIRHLQEGKAFDEPQKPKVPQVAVKFYEQYKDNSLLLGEWFSDFYSSEAIEEFPRMEELSEWLYENDNEINKQREFALATLVTFGIDAVEVEKEKLYTVEIPNPQVVGEDTFALMKNGFKNVVLVFRVGRDWKKQKGYQLTEEEIRKDFDWAWEWAKPVEREQ